MPAPVSQSDDCPSIVYRIQCTPIDRQRTSTYLSHSFHSICAFSSSEKALAYLPNPPSTYDSEDCVEWFYKVAPVEATKVLLAILDKPPPSHFPYRGW